MPDLFGPGVASGRDNQAPYPAVLLPNRLNELGNFFIPAATGKACGSGPSGADFKNWRFFLKASIRRGELFWKPPRRFYQKASNTQ
jgi:hypothetical protein